jgi:hypothetical protein
MKNAIFWDVTPCGSCKNRRFVRTYHVHEEGDNNRRATNNVNSNEQPKHPAFFTVTAVKTSYLTQLHCCSLQEVGQHIQILNRNGKLNYIGGTTGLNISTSTQSIRLE